MRLIWRPKLGFPILETRGPVAYNPNQWNPSLVTVRTARTTLVFEFEFD